MKIRRGSLSQFIRINFSVNDDFTKAWSLGGPLVAQTGKTSGFLGLRRTGYAGTDYYFIFGSPVPAGKFEPMLTVKVVKPLWATAEQVWRGH